MDEPLAVALKFGFLLVLYLFLLWIARSAMRDLARYEGAAATEAPEPVRSRGRDSARPDLRAGVAPRLEVVAAMGHEPGTAFELLNGATLGRAESSDIRVDDPFASSAHARIFQRGDFMYIEDMGSTNGTFLNGRQLRSAERLKPADLVRIGDTEYRNQE
jgi:pSer/pThr/pTyr-binding forkhead associated (FHA) protein